MNVNRADLRPVDLARLVGVSTQQIRNYEEAGILPPVERTRAGHRRYDAHHSVALIAYRALAAGYGVRTARAIMCAVHAGDVDSALALVDEGHAALHEQRHFLRETGEALQAVAEQVPETAGAPRSGLYIRDVAARLGVRTSALRVWESAVLTPQREHGTGYRRYGPAELRDARMIHLLRQGHCPLPQIGPVLDGLRRTGSSDELRAAIARRQADLTRRATAMLEAAGHLHQCLTDDGEGSLTSGSS
jgi:DNA-binding transcriptional MerR regulator